ncbi:MAG: HAD hydrolase-like protein [bacterium]|nr:HAD hydrolase-like protein [bacterium]
MKKPRVIIYDNDGMITNGGRFSEQYSKEFGVDPSVMTPFFEGPFKNCLMGKADLKEELKKVLDEWKWEGTVDELMQYWFSIGDSVYDDIYASILKLKEQGLTVCLATNQEKYRTEYLVKKLSYDKIFDEIFLSADLGVYKHSPDGLEKIFQVLKEEYAISDKEEIMYWDDREDHVEALNKLGFNGQLYRDYPSFRAVLSEAGYQL